MWQDDNKQTGTRSTGIEPAAMTPTSRDTEHGVGVRDGWLVRVVVNVCRLVLGATLVLSGFVKAIDPLGTQYKIQDYLTAVGWPGIAPDVVTIGASVLLSAFEFSIGIFVLFAIRRRLVSKLALALMSVMTIVTLWILVANPVKDCGCFGDFADQRGDISQEHRAAGLCHCAGQMAFGNVSFPLTLHPVDSH